MVLWIGYLQWQVRQPGGAMTVPEPVLTDYGNIECRDAVLAYDREELLLDEHGKPVTRWDGETMKVSPVTGEKVPDEKSRVPVYRYLKPQQAEWPRADFIIGNPPYIGNWRMRQVFGDGYVEALRLAYPDVPHSSDYVFYWWHRAARQVCTEATRRFGLITTNSISQAFGRKVIRGSLLQRGGAIVYALPDHPWVNSEDGAAVRVAMTVGEKGEANGALIEVVQESEAPDGHIQIEVKQTGGRIHADLTVGADVAGAGPLQANAGITCPGVKLHGKGFQVSADEAAALGLQNITGLERHLRPYANGKDLLHTSRGHLVIDLYGLKIQEVRQRFPEVYQWVLERVKPERDQNRREGRRTNWWVFGEPVPAWREMSEGLGRFIATVETSKHRVFVFLPANLLPDNMITAIGMDDAFYLGILSSLVHVTWALAAGGTLEDRPRYNKTRCFDPFPFPACSEAQKQRIRDLGEALDAHRKRQQAQHPKLTITGMYNVLEKLRTGEPLTEKEREIHEQGLVSILKQIHDDLDAAVFEAYGWPATLTDEEILERLVTLNQERAEEEKRGLIRWLRPEFQNPQGVKAETQATLVEAGLEPAVPAQAAKAKKAAKLPWPKDLPGRIVAARDLLAELGEAAADDFSRRFARVKPDDAEKLLESLAAVGVAIETTAQGSRRTWRLLR